VPVHPQVPAALFSWPVQPGASGYLVRVLQGGRAVLEVRPKTPRFVLPERIRTKPGHYRWIVFVLQGTRLGRAIVDSTFTIAPAGASSSTRS
jgi:hypothetical protein